MRKLLCVTGIVAFGLASLAAQGTTAAKKKSAAKKSSHPAVAAHKTAGTTKTSATKSATTRATTSKTGTTRTTAARRGKKAPVRRTTWRNRQLAPTPQRYKEIQEALSAKGYLPPDQATGTWDSASASALKKFQTDQNLEGSGKINSLSLIALGLGPSHETTASSKPAAPPTVTP